MGEGVELEGKGGLGKKTNAEGRIRVRDRPVERRGICSLGE
jgi:hypothetical protein